MPSRIDLGETSFPDLLVDDKLADGIAPMLEMPGRGGRRGSVSHDFLQRVGESRKRAGLYGSPGAYKGGRSLAVGGVVMYTSGGCLMQGEMG